MRLLSIIYISLILAGSLAFYQISKYQTPLFTSLLVASVAVPIALITWFGVSFIKFWSVTFTEEGSLKLNWGSKAIIENAADRISTKGQFYQFSGSKFRIEKSMHPNLEQQLRTPEAWVNTPPILVTNELVTRQKPVDSSVIKNIAISLSYCFSLAALVGNGYIVYRLLFGEIEYYVNNRACSSDFIHHSLHRECRDSSN